MRAMNAWIAAGIALAACGGGNEGREAQIEKEMARRGLDGAVELDDEGEVKSVTIKRGGQTIGRDLALPEGFPSDVPVSANWEIIHSTPTPNGGFMVQALVKSNVDAALDEIRTAMSGGGWTETQFQQPVPTMTSVAFEKDDRMTTVNFLGADGDQLNAQLATMPKP